MTIPRGENSGDKREEAVEASIEAWKHELPEMIRDFDGQMIPPEELFQRYDAVIVEAAKNKEWNNKVIEGLKKDRDANSFWLAFSSNDAAAALRGGEGMRGTSGFKPFYINARHNNAWSRMCEQFPEYVISAVGCADDLFEDSSRHMTEEEKESISSLALYLSEKEKVLATFIWK